MSRLRVAHMALVRRVRATRSVVYLLAGLVMISTAGPAAAQDSKPPYNERPAEAQAVISGSRYDGTYSLGEVARVCGEVPPEMNFSGVPVFTVHLYPEDGEAELMDVTFDSKELVGGVTATAKFFLSLNVHTPSGGSPPAFVLDTSKPNTAGTAELSYPDPGTVKLNVHGFDDMGVTYDLELTCMPRI